MSVPFTAPLTPFAHPSRNRAAPRRVTLTGRGSRTPPSDPATPLVDVAGVESSTNELPLSALTFGAGGGGGSWPRLRCSVWAAGRRQRHSIAGQMSYLKMLGLGARGKAPGAAAGLFSTAVISGSSSAPNLRVMIPSAAAADGQCLTAFVPATATPSSAFLTC